LLTESLKKKEQQENKIRASMNSILTSEEGAREEDGKRKRAIL
jgi:hypothetical protein